MSNPIWTPDKAIVMDAVQGVDEETDQIIYRGIYVKTPYGTRYFHPNGRDTLDEFQVASAWAEKRKAWVYEDYENVPESGAYYIAPNLSLLIQAINAFNVQNPKPDQPLNMLN